jgi:acetamidase/formamidase
MFGCSEGGRSLWHLRDDVMERAVDEDRLTRQDGLDSDRVGLFLETRRLTRRDALRAGGALALATAAAPAFADLASAHPGPSAPVDRVASAPLGAQHVIPSTPETVRLGQIDSTLPLIDTIESGDTLVYPNTMSHFLDRLQPGVTIEEIAQLRRDNPGRGPHTIIGPVAVRGAEPGDLVACRFDRLLPKSWGANFNNPGELRTGALPDEFPQGQVKYFDLDLNTMTTQFGPGIRLDLRDLNEGSTLYIPVWQPGALIFTGDSHVLQGDGEVNVTAIESAMQEVRVTVTLHKTAGDAWPLAETSRSTRGNGGAVERRRAPWWGEAMIAA